MLHSILPYPYTILKFQILIFPTRRRVRAKSHQRDQFIYQLNFEGTKVHDLVFGVQRRRVEKFSGITTWQSHQLYEVNMRYKQISTARENARTHAETKTTTENPATLVKERTRQRLILAPWGSTRGPTVVSETSCSPARLSKGCVFVVLRCCVLCPGTLGGTRERGWNGTLMHVPGLIGW
jgi:hypothetical protein